MKLQKLAGATSEIWQVFIADSTSTTGGGLTGLTNASGGLTAYYHRDTDTTATAISLVTMTVGTFTSSGFKEIDATNMPGWYQFCPPNAAIASGAKSAAFHLKGATNMVPLPIECQLTAVNPDDATAFGLSRLDAAITTRQATVTFPTNFSSLSIDASGRVDLGKWIGVAPVALSASGYVSAMVLRWLTDNAGGTPNALISGRVDANAGVVGDKTGYSLTQTFPTNFSTLSIDASGRVDVAKVAGTSQTARDLGAQLDATVSSRLASATIVSQSGTATAGGASTITLTGASATDSIYNGQTVVLLTNTGAGQSRVITGYVGSTKVATVDRAWQTNPDATTTYAVLSLDSVKTDASLQVVSASVQGNVTGSVASVTGAVGSVTGAVGSVTAGVTVTTNNDKTGYALSTAGVQAVWDEATSSLTTVGSIGKRLADDIDATVSSRSTFAGGAVASVTGNVGGNVVGSIGSVAAGGIANTSFGVGAIDATAIASSAENAIADALLDRDMSTGTDSGSPSVRTVRQSLRVLRNKASIAAGTLTVTKEDDATSSWTAAVTTSAGNPISTIDPA